MHPYWKKGVPGYYHWIRYMMQRAHTTIIITLYALRIPFEWKKEKRTSLVPIKLLSRATFMSQCVSSSIPTVRVKYTYIYIYNNIWYHPISGSSWCTFCRSLIVYIFSYGRICATHYKWRESRYIGFSSDVCDLKLNNK